MCKNFRLYILLLSIKPNLLSWQVLGEILSDWSVQIKVMTQLFTFDGSNFTVEIYSQQYSHQLAHLESEAQLGNAATLWEALIFECL